MKRFAIFAALILLPTIAEARWWRRAAAQPTYAAPRAAAPAPTPAPAPAKIAAAPVPAAVPTPAPAQAAAPVAAPATATDADGLYPASRVFPGAHCCEGQQHPLLMALAAEQANRQACLCQQGHQCFESRYQRIAQSLGMGSAEIAAESWPEQRNSSAYDLGMEMFKCWRQSPGHWSVACKPHKYWGGAIRQGRNGIWYATILVAD